MPPVRALILAALAASFAAPIRSATLRETAGLVQVRPAGESRWRPAGAPPRKMGPGDALRTGANARAAVAAADGSAFEARGSAHVTLDDESSGKLALSVHFGTLRLEAGLRSAAVQVRVPTGLVRVRSAGAELRFAVTGGGASAIEALRGSAGIEDDRGRTLLLREGERVELDSAGLHEPLEAAAPRERKKLDARALARRELALDAARDADFAFAARESRRQERELGRVLLDPDGRRVRVEEFVVRPAADRLVLVTLNGRASGLSYLSFDARFDRALPRDLSPVLAALSTFKTEAAPWTLESFVETLSNGRDSLVERADGGHQVDLNANADPTDDVAGQAAAFTTLFDRFGLYSNGQLKRGWTGANLQTYADATPAANNDPITGAALGAPLPAVTLNESFPDAGAARRESREDYGDGSELVRDDTALFGPEGGAGRRGDPLGAGLERRLRASEFGGREIRLLMGLQGALFSDGGLP